MILVVNINPAIDKIYSIENFKLDKIHRTSNVLIQAGGKGINVARTCKVLNEEALVTGMVGGVASQIILSNLDKSKIKHDFYLVDQESRTCLILIDPINKTQTVINEDGPLFTDADIDNFILKIQTLLDKTKVLVISGSIPHSVKRNIYNELVTIAVQEDILTIVDASKNALKNVIDAKPYMIKPNIYEYCEVFGDDSILNKALSGNFSPLINNCKKILDKGIQNVTITLGQLGAIYIGPEKQFLVKAPKVKVLNTIASGDAMTAALAIDLLHNKSIEEAVISGVSAGSANATIGGLRFTRELFLELKKQTILKTICVSDA